MANLYSVQLQRTQAQGNQYSNGIAEIGAKIRDAYFERNTTDAVNGNVANGDTIELVRIPKYARILDGTIAREALGASVTVSLGTKNTDGSGTPAPTSLLVATDFSAAGVTYFPSSYALLFGQVTTAETTVYATIGGANPAGNKMINGYVQYLQN